jgi:3-mercaptopyruvate sulfurtransferase SseA
MDGSCLSRTGRKGDLAFTHGLIIVLGFPVNNVLAAGFRTDADDDNPMTLVDFEDVAEILGNAGIGATDHVVVYDKAGPISGFFLWVLEYAGVKNVSYLKGGIEGWHEAGYHVTDKATAAKVKTFDGKPNPKFVADNAFVKANLDKAGVVVLDARIVTQANGMIAHGAAERGGHIPGSLNLPLASLYMDKGYSSHRTRVAVDVEEERCYAG